MRPNQEGVQWDSVGLVHSHSPYLYGKECRKEQHTPDSWIPLAGIPPPMWVSAGNPTLHLRLQGGLMHPGPGGSSWEVLISATPLSEEDQDPSG